MTQFPIADRWFDQRRRGSRRDLIIDTGMGIASLVEAADNLFDKGTIDADPTTPASDAIGSATIGLRTSGVRSRSANM